MDVSLPPLPPIEQIDRKTNSSALAAGVCGISSIVMQLIGLGLAAAVDPSVASICNGIGGFAWLAGIVLGVVGLVQIRRHPSQKGKDWAITGIGLGILRICIVVVVVLLLIPGSAFGTVSTQISRTLAAP